MRLSVGFTEDSPQLALAGPAADRLTAAFYPDAERIGATRSLIMGGQFLEALRVSGEPIDGTLAAFVDDVAGDDDSLMVQLTWTPT